MVKRFILLLATCFMFLNSGFCSTEIKPPEGPFVSLLRATYSAKLATTVNVKINSETKKEYNFQVPDLGRYQERVVPDLSIQNASPISTLLSQEQGFNRTNILDNAFDPNVFEQTSIDDQSQNLSPYANPGRVTDRRIINKPMSFDSLPIEKAQSIDEQSYPLEWGQPSFFKQSRQFDGFNQRSSINQKNEPSKKSQKSSMMGMPFPNQMPLWPLGNNSNLGH